MGCTTWPPAIRFTLLTPARNVDCPTGQQRQRFNGCPPDSPSVCCATVRLLCCQVVHPPARRYPTGQECQRYIERYAADAGLLPLTTFGVTVTSVAPKLTNGHTLETADGSDGWEVKWRDEKG